MHTPSTAYTQYCIHPVLHTPSTAYTEYCIHRVLHTPSTAYTEYYIHLVLHARSTAYTQYFIHRVLHTPSTAYTMYCITKVLHTLNTPSTNYCIHWVLHPARTSSTESCIISWSTVSHSQLVCHLSSLTSQRTLLYPTHHVFMIMSYTMNIVSAPVTSSCRSTPSRSTTVTPLELHLYFRDHTQSLEDQYIDVWSEITNYHSDFYFGSTFWICSPISHISIVWPLHQLIHDNGHAKCK